MMSYDYDSTTNMYDVRIKGFSEEEWGTVFDNQLQLTVGPWPDLAGQWLRGVANMAISG